MLLSVRHRVVGLYVIILVVLYIFISIIIKPQSLQIRKYVHVHVGLYSNVRLVGYMHARVDRFF